MLVKNAGLNLIYSYYNMEGNREAMVKAKPFMHIMGKDKYEATLIPLIRLFTPPFSDPMFIDFRTNETTEFNSMFSSRIIEEAYDRKKIKGEELPFGPLRTIETSTADTQIGKRSFILNFTNSTIVSSIKGEVRTVHTPIDKSDYYYRDKSCHMHDGKIVLAEIYTFKDLENIDIERNNDYLKYDLTNYLESLTNIEGNPEIDRMKESIKLAIKGKTVATGFEQVSNNGSKTLCVLWMTVLDGNDSHALLEGNDVYLEDMDVLLSTRGFKDMTLHPSSFNKRKTYSENLLEDQVVEINIVDKDHSLDKVFTNIMDQVVEIPVSRSGASEPGMYIGSFVGSTENSKFIPMKDLKTSKLISSNKADALRSKEDSINDLKYEKEKQAQEIKLESVKKEKELMELKMRIAREESERKRIHELEDLLKKEKEYVNDNEFKLKERNYKMMELIIKLGVVALTTIGTIWAWRQKLA